MEKIQARVDFDKENLINYAEMSNESTKLVRYRKEDTNINDLYHYMHMSREDLKLLIYTLSMNIISVYNGICDPKHRKTPDLIYAPLIEECNKNLMVDINNLLNNFNDRINILKDIK
jgi:hypothetical protein